MKDANQQKIAKKNEKIFFLFLKSFQKISSKFPILFRIRKRKQKLHIFIKSTFFYFLVGCCLFDNFFYFLVSLFLVMACFYAFAIFGSFFQLWRVSFILRTSLYIVYVVFSFSHFHTDSYLYVSTMTHVFEFFYTLEIRFFFLFSFFFFLRPSNKKVLTDFYYIMHACVWIWKRM